MGRFSQPLRWAPLLIALAFAGCLWRGDAEVMRVHLDVLSSLADKAADTAAAGRRPTSNDVVELTYPLQRARQFADAHAAQADQPAYRAFNAALARYQAMVEAIDGARGDEARWAAARPLVQQDYEAFRAAVAAARSTAS